MANAILTIKIMPSSPDTDLAELESKASEFIRAFTSREEIKAVIEPVAFGLKSLSLTFIMDEALGSPEELEKQIQAIEGVNSAETVDVRRAVG